MADFFSVPQTSSIEQTHTSCIKIALRICDFNQELNCGHRWIFRWHGGEGSLDRRHFSNSKFVKFSSYADQIV
jgi:hypothetical protein